MTKADHDAFMAMAPDMAATNGYHVLQSADWYITDGDEVDWMYGRQGIFSFTLEVYPPSAPSTTIRPTKRSRSRPSGTARRCSTSSTWPTAHTARAAPKRSTAGSTETVRGPARPGSPQLGSVVGKNLQWPSEMTSTVPSTTLMAVSSSIAYAGPSISAAQRSAAAMVFSGRSG